MASKNYQRREVNPVLENERKRATFNPKELTTIIDTSEENTNERHLVEKFFYEDPNMPDNLAMLSLNHDDFVKATLKTALYFESKIDNSDLPNQLPLNLQYARSHYIRPITFPEENPLALHSAMFIPAITSQGTEEQQARWLPLIEAQKMLGTYAQTELGHGSNIRDLETTATYDPNTEEFVLHSPTLTSIKCWAGGLGTACNHAIVMAQLYTKGKCYGLHMFLVQLRSMEDHKPLPGIALGDIGPKMGMAATDNGFLQFDHFRIPRMNMLMNHAKVLKDGTYVKPKFERANYGVMVYIRIGIVGIASTFLGQMTTIAVRYNVIRRQGRLKNDGPEVQILDYQTQQYKLIPQVAVAYALWFAFRKLCFFYMRILSERTAAGFNEMHALASGMKALSTHLSSTGGDVCRQACGGLGYLKASRMPALYSNAVAACTYEGDNTILNLQTARYLMKTVKIIENGEDVSDSVKYLKEQTINRNSHLAEFVQMFETTTRRMIKNLANRLQLSEDKNENAWQESALELVRCAHFHSLVYTIQAVDDFLCNTKMSNSLRDVMENLFELFCAYLTQQNAGDFAMFGGYSEIKLNEIRTRIPKLLKLLRPNIVALVDAFDFCDASLHSVIGSYDGRVYERLCDYWAQLPANKNLKTLLKSRL